MTQREIFEVQFGKRERYHTTREWDAMWNAWQQASQQVTHVETHISNLLARIHRDGGHYEVEHGTDKACKDADLIVAKLNAMSDRKVVDEMDAVAIQHAHKMALDLECILSNYIGPWYDTAMETLSGYRMAMNAIHERESPTHFGEPAIKKTKP